MFDAVSYINLIAVMWIDRAAYIHQFRFMGPAHQSVTHHVIIHFLGFLELLARSP